MIETIQVDPHDVHKDIIGKSFIVTVSTAEFSGFGDLWL